MILICIQGPCPETPVTAVWGVISKPLGDDCRLERDFCHSAGYAPARSLYKKCGVELPYENLFLYQVQILWVLLNGCHQVSRG